MLMRPSRFLCLFLLAAVCGPGLRAQSPQTGAFTGTVVDENGQPLVGATVVFNRLDYEFERRIDTDEQGRFYYGGFLPGPYRITLLRDGHVVWTTQARMTSLGSEQRFDVDLKELKEEAEQRSRLDPALERRRDAEREREARAEELHQHYGLATRYLQENRAEDAIREFQAVLDREPGNATAHSLLGLAYADAGRHPEAIASFRRALELEPHEAAHHNNLGALLIRTGQVQDGVRHIEQAARLDADRAATYHFNIGAALLNAGRPRDAVGHFRQALRSDPTFAVAHFFLGVALVRGSSREESAPAAPGAAEAFQRYLQLAPDGPYADKAREHLKHMGAAPESAPASVSSVRDDH